ncbi:MAG: DMT family transporter [Clostridia bacterium]|nr:DMT family transporter [Clostridia bacterium]
MKSFYFGAILVSVSALGYGIMPVFAKFAYKGGINTTTLLLIRFGLAALLFFSYLLIRYRKISISLKQVGVLFILGGICYTGQSFLYFSAVKHIPGSLATLLVYVAPVLVAVFSFFIDKERITLKVILPIAVAFTGLVIVCKDSIGKVDFRGIIMALGAALVYAFYVILSNRVVKQLPAVMSSAFITFFTAVALLSGGTASGSVSLDFKPVTWVYIAALVMISTVLALAAFLAGLDRLGSTKASILSMLEPVFAVIFSVAFLAEKLTVYQLFGGMIVITGAFMVIRPQKTDKKSTNGKELN